MNSKKLSHDRKRTVGYRGLIKLSIEKAKIVVQKLLLDMDSSGDLVLTKELATDFGYLFSCNSKKYLESGNLSDAIFGGGPIFIYQETYEVVKFPSYQSAESSLGELEKFLKSNGPKPNWLA